MQPSAHQFLLSTPSSGLWKKLANGFLESSSRGGAQPSELPRSRLSPGLLACLVGVGRIVQQSALRHGPAAVL